MIEQEHEVRFFVDEDHEVVRARGWRENDRFWFYTSQGKHWETYANTASTVAEAVALARGKIVEEIASLAASIQTATESLAKLDARRQKVWEAAEL